MVPLFSVIIPTYDRPLLLWEAVASVLGQTVEDLECVVVDDASPELASLPDDSRVRLIRRTENGGEPAARNTGLREARGRYVTFLDDDDLYTRDRLALALEGLGRAPVSICWRRGLDGSTGGNRYLNGDVTDAILDGLTPQMGQVAIARDIAPLFDERFPALTDVDWWLRTARLAGVATVPQVGLLYRIHKGPRNRNGPIQRVQSSLTLLDVHSDYFSAHPRAAAFRWRRIGIMAAALGDRSLARSAFLRSLRIKPAPRTIWHLTRALRPSSSRVSAEAR